MTFDKAANQFVLNTTSYPLVNGVSFRCISSASSYPDSISNVIGPFNLASTQQHLGATSLLISTNGPIAGIFFRAFVPASPSGIQVRIQSTITPGDESTWVDLNNGSAGIMQPLSVANQFFLLLNNYPPAIGLYLRAVTSASGYIDHLSAARGPFKLITDKPPVVTMAPPPGLAGSGDGRDLDHPILVPAGTFKFGATAVCERQIKSFVLRYDGSTITRAEPGFASVRTDYTTNVIGIMSSKRSPSMISAAEHARAPDRCTFEWFRGPASPSDNISWLDSGRDVGTSRPAEDFHGREVWR